MDLAQRAARKGNRQVRPASVFSGFIDGIRPSSFIEGWAYDQSNPWTPLEVRIRVEGEWVASGLACHFRDDLLVAGIGTGWCGFTLQTDADLADLGRSTLYLVEKSGVVINKAERPALMPDHSGSLRTIADVLAADPTMTVSVEQLRGCEALFARFVRSHGVEAFVRTTYVYMLGRPADEAGLAMYANRVRRGTHQPFELLQILATSEEFLDRRPHLIAPNQPSFPFLVD